MLRVFKMQCEYKENPINVDRERPEFAWKLSSDAENVCQTAYRMQVWAGEAVHEENLLWDSGKRESSDTYGIRYEGKELESRSVYLWQVTAWDTKGEQAVSEVQVFETVFLDIQEWQAGLIEPDSLPRGLDNDPLEAAQEKWNAFLMQMMQGKMEEYLDIDSYIQAQPMYPFYPAVMMYRKFQAEDSLVRARLYITAHGVYEFYINGERTTDACLTPEFTTYDKLLKYQVYDVTDAIRHGENAVGVVIADGWYKGKIANGRGCEYGDNPGLLLELDLVYADGRTERICSDEEFVYSYDSPYLRADIYNGETYDARKQVKDFGSAVMDTSCWKTVHEMPFEKSVLMVQTNAPIRPVKELEPQKLYVNGQGETILDMGQNIAGHIRISGMEGDAGTEIMLEHTEELAPDGSFTYPFTGKVQAQKDIYIFNGEGVENWEPSFTYHGFRYVKITGQGKTPWKIEQFKGIVVTSDNEKAGEFRCSDEKLNKLQENIVWSQLGNMIGTPTDCPTREKAGWTGDVVVYAKTACFNQSLLNFYKEWLKSVRAEQLENGVVQNTVPLIKNYIQQLGSGSVGWGDVILTLPWDLYRIYGDKSVLEENYEAMKKWMGYLEDMAYNQLPPEAESLSGEALENQHYLLNTGFHFGDWLVPSIVNEAGFADGPKSSFLTGFPVATAIFAGNTDIMCEIAQILGDQEAVEKYASLGKKIRKAFTDTWLLEDGTLQNDLQGLYVLALQMNMVPEEKRERLLSRLTERIEENNGCMDTGFMSVPYILEVLSENGRKKEAHGLLYQNQCPSWLYEVEHGATTMWESWNAIKPDGSKDGCSFNHYAFGCVGDWMYKNLLGIKNDGVAYDKVIIEPDYEAGLSYAKGFYDSVHGPICVEWQKEEDEIILQIEIPVNVRAVVRYKGQEKAVGSGKYSFCYKTV